MRESAEPVGTDHTGDIVSFTAVGSGAPGTNPRPWFCYTLPLGHNVDSPSPSNVEWQTPDGVDIVREDPPADNGVATRLVVGRIPGIVLSRGTNYFSPDRDYCCVITMGGTESERRWVVPMLLIAVSSSGRVSRRN